jgi:hypothetical protein
MGAVALIADRVGRLQGGGEHGRALDRVKKGLRRLITVDARRELENVEGSHKSTDENIGVGRLRRKGDSRL